MSPKAAHSADHRGGPRRLHPRRARGAEPDGADGVRSGRDRLRLHPHRAGPDGRRGGSDKPQPQATALPSWARWGVGAGLAEREQRRELRAARGSSLGGHDVVTRGTLPDEHVPRPCWADTEAVGGWQVAQTTPAGGGSRVAGAGKQADVGELRTPEKAPSKDPKGCFGQRPRLEVWPSAGLLGGFTGHVHSVLDPGGGVGARPRSADASPGSQTRGWAASLEGHDLLDRGPL